MWCWAKTPNRPEQGNLTPWPLRRNSSRGMVSSQGRASPSSALGRIVSGAAGASLLPGVVAASLGAQGPVRVVPDVVACTTCSLHVSAIAELGDRDGPGIVGEQAIIGRSDDGEYYVSSLVQRGRLLRFSADGVYQDALGRTGEGPGEYIWPVLLRRSPDTLSILDYRANRLTTIRNGEIATWRLPFIVDTWAVLPDGRHVYNGLSYTPDLVGLPLHVYDEESRRITTSFGHEGVRVDRSPRSRRALRRRVAVAADGNIWAARSNRYRIDKWSPDGDHIMRIERDAPWFRPWEEWPGVDYEVRPLPAIVGVRDWGGGLLMVIVRVADREWRPMHPARIVQDHEVTSAAQEEELYDTVIEVLDIRSGTVLGRTRVAERVVGLVGRDGFYSYAEHSELGEPKYVVWSVSLSGYPAAPGNQYGAEPGE